jgi:hypothetical protein
MNVDLYADPSCPWCWAAYLWLDEVAPARQLRVRVQPFSLALRDGTAHLPPPLRAAREQTHRALRVAAAIESADERTSFYAAVTAPLFAALAAGRAPHVDIPAALAGAHLEAGLADRAEDLALDAAIEASMRTVAEVMPPGEAKQLVPVLVLRTDDGPRACQGPLLDPPAHGHEALELWDLTERLLRMPNVYGVSRPHPAPHSLVDVARG